MNPAHDALKKLAVSRLQIARPLCVFDIEATGLNPDLDRIIELAAVRIEPGGAITCFDSLFNPGMPIPREATEVHGIKDSDVARAPAFAEQADAILALFEGADLAGYNVRRYDVSVLAAEMARCRRSFSIEGRLILDGYAIFARQEPRHLAAALQFYCGATHYAHRAMNDVDATVRVLSGQLERYADLPATLAELSEYCNPRDRASIDAEGKLAWRNGEACINFGKNRGRSLRELAQSDKSYLHWIQNGSFSVEVKDIVRAALAGSFPKAPAPARVDPA